MALKTMIEDLNQAREAYNTKRKELAASSKDAIGKALGGLLPPGFVLIWTQYTPHFNDGEACEFGVHDPYLVVADKANTRYRDVDDVGLYLSSAVKKYGTPDETKEYRERDWSARGEVYRTKTYIDPGFPAIEGYSKDKLEELVAVWDSLPEDMMENAFGDHVKVVLRADGSCDVDEYEHD